jgi:hypothetical protein
VVVASSRASALHYEAPRLHTYGSAHHRLALASGPRDSSGRRGGLVAPFITHVLTDLVIVTIVLVLVRT